MCTGRVDLSFVLRAFSKGKDGVFIGGCHLGDCHYVTEGNYHALHMVKLCKKLLGFMGINPERLAIEWISAGEGVRFAEVVNAFSKKVQSLGPLGADGGADAAGLKFKLDALTRLLPYIRLVERERLRVKFKSEEEYEAFFESEEITKLLQELVGDKLAVSEVTLLLRESPRSIDEICDILKFTPSQAARHLGNSAKQGLVRYDEGRGQFSLV